MSFKIYIFCNTCEPQWHSIQALCECGHFICGHICSSHGFIPHDMGLGHASKLKHEYYKQHADGHHNGAEFELEEVMGFPKDSPELMAAYANHLKLKEKVPPSSLVV